MATYLKDLIHIPEKIHKGDFVLKLAEGVEHPEQTLRDYVVTPQLQECFKDALGFVQSAVDGKASKMTYLHGSFGSGKSHFMAVLNLILGNHKAARAKKDLQEICAQNLWTEKHKFLMVPYHMIGAASMEQAILGGYVDFVHKAHPEAARPGVYLAQGLFEDAARLRANFGDEKFFQVLNGGDDQDDDDLGDYDLGWDAESYQQAVEAPPESDERLQLVSDLVTRMFTQYAHVTSGKAEAYLPLDQGLSIVSRHAKSLGYDGVILFLDELILWLASRAADIKFVHQEGQKLAKLVEAQQANRPIPLISFVARQRDLRELVGENITGVEELNFDDAFRHWGGRFHTITLEDINLPDIVAGRVLKPRDQAASEQLDEAFNKSSKVRDEVMQVLLTSRGNREMFRKVYPFSPALVETLVAVSGALQRNRTAIKALMELLVEQRQELTLGKVIPVGDLFDIVAHGEEVFTQGMRQAFNNAKRLYQDRFRPLLEEEHKVQEDRDLPLKGDEDPQKLKAIERFRNDARLVKTLLLSALVPGVESFEGLTAQRLAALNHGTISSPLPGQEASIVLGKIKKWAAQIGELRYSEGENPIVSLQLVGVDTERILEHSKHMDNTGNRKKKIRELVLECTGIQSQDLFNTYSMLWRGTQWDFPIEFANVREKTRDSLRHSGDGWHLLIDFPFDEQEYGPKDDLGKLDDFRKSQEVSKTLVWLPNFFTSKVQNELGRLIMLDHVLSGDNFKEATRHLSPQDVPQAEALLKNQRSALRNRLIRDLEMAYGVVKPDKDVVNPALSMELNEQFQSLWGGFAPRPPVGTDLKSSMQNLLAQALQEDYPGHPDFPVESRITTKQVQTVWEELARLPEVGGERLEVDPKLRARVRQIAQPLQLGQMAETHFVPSRHWLDHFDRKLALQKLSEPTVADLDTWMDDPRPTGLPRSLRDLVVLSYASRTNRSFELHGTSLQPELGKIPREARLVMQALPSEDDWEQARQRAQVLLGVEASSLLNADTVARFAEQTRTRAAELRDPCQELPGVLAESLAELQLKPDDSQRLHAAREAREFLKGATAQGKPKALVEALAGLRLSCSLPELAASMRTAVPLLQALRNHRFDVFHVLPDNPTGQAIRGRLNQAFLEHEFVTPLVVTLKECTDHAWAEVHKKKPVVDPTPPKPIEGGPGPATKTRRSVSQQTFEKLSPNELETQLAALRKQVKKGRRVDLSWTVWEGDD